MELADLVRALDPLGPTPLAVRKLFARVHAHGAESVEDLRGTPQVPRAVRYAVLARAELPSLTVVGVRVCLNSMHSLGAWSQVVTILVH